MKINSDKFILTQDELKKIIQYDPTTGQMVRITKRGKVNHYIPVNYPLMSSNNRGYRWVSIGRVVYLQHRLAFLWMAGKHPDGEVDHINGDRQDNRWENLRDSDATGQSRNQGIRKDCTSGVRGVTWSSIHKKWVARISNLNVRHSLGYFKNFNDAVNARREAEIKYGYHENHAKRNSWES